MTVTSRWNSVIYRLWAPVYDLLFDRLFFASARRRSLRALAVRSGERVLLPGVGTGADLPLLPHASVAIGVDFSPHMLAQAQRKLTACAATVLLVQGDAQRLPVADGAMDAAVLHLVLSVVPDGQACAAETARCLRTGGRAVVFDKFVAEGAAEPSRLRRLINLGAVRLGTDLNRRLSALLASSDLVMVDDRPALLGDVYRIVRLVRRRVRSAALVGDVDERVGALRRVLLVEEAT
jgi:phosphatidylethanolamine/phosphatidyl-N-methylethanolamine N-methyltransferase